MSLFPAYSGASPAPNSLFITFFFKSGVFSLQISLLFSCNQTFFVFLFSEILAISSRAKKDLFKMVSKFNSELRTLKKTWEVKTTLFFFSFFFLLFRSIYHRLLCSPTGPRHVLHSDTLTPSTSLQTVAIFPLVTTGGRRYFTGMPCHACIPNLSRFPLPYSRLSQK